MRTLRNLTICVLGSAVWPGYLGLAAYAARQAPWPRGMAYPTSASLGMLALAALAANLLRWLTAPRGWAEDVLEMPPDVTRQVRVMTLVLVVASAAILMPAWLLGAGFVTSGGRPVPAPMVIRVLVLVFELVVLAVAARVLRRRSPLVNWLAESPPSGLSGLARNRRLLSVAALSGVVAVIVLDAFGYSYSARRLSTGAAGSVVAAALCWGLYRALSRLIEEHAWTWFMLGQALKGVREPSTDPVMHDDLAGRLRKLSGYFAASVWLLAAAWVWDVDLALFRFVSDQSLWSMTTIKGVDGLAVPLAVKVGDLTKALVILGLTIAAWRNLSTFFAVVVFPRMPDDPGIRFAAVTLSRYAVLGLGLIIGLSAVHLGLEKIGMVLAALGVGLGFGLQEIVSNFVCGVILLLERPIRVGDIVTVSGMSGKVDRINIRATTIINGDNQSIIVPNRAFVTGDLINWTLKDKIIRLAIKVQTAYGTDPDRVSELLQTIARDDADVLRNPAPSALVEDMTETGLAFVLHVHVPDPGLGGRVRHRIVREIQQRFQDEGILMPVPTQKLLVDPREFAPFRVGADSLRADTASTTPPPPMLHSPTAPKPVPSPVAECNRGVDE